RDGTAFSQGARSGRGHLRGGAVAPRFRTRGAGAGPAGAARRATPGTARIGRPVDPGLAFLPPRVARREGTFRRVRGERRIGRAARPRTLLAISRRRGRSGATATAGDRSRCPRLVRIARAAEAAARGSGNRPLSPSGPAAAGGASPAAPGGGTAFRSRPLRGGRSGGGSLRAREARPLRRP